MRKGAWTGSITSRSRLNHSCLANVWHGYDPNDDTIIVHAMRDIFPGEELTRSYIETSYLTSEERQEELAMWGFKCRCEACTPSVFAISGDMRRKIVADRHVLMESATPRNELLNNLESMSRLIEVEGIYNRELEKCRRVRVE
ncbi:hypothetical protein MRB53_039429 [Persea americana]|nr:hypothetical protein MRB53_039429 [Persea americana]